MTRRSAAALVFGAAAWARPQKQSIDEIAGALPGAAVLLDVRTRSPISVYHADIAGGLLVPPGSAIKPFTLGALLANRKIKDTESFVCPGALTIGGRPFNCSHPPIATPIDARTALAYSCNCFTAHFAERFAPGELAAYLVRYGLSSPSGWLGGEGTGRIEPATTHDSRQLQAIGEAGVLVTAAEMAAAYRKLALSAPDAIRGGLEGAVEFGTAQHAGVDGIKVAGKTGSVRAADGATYAWFCGFAPSQAARVVVAVLLAGRSGGADAAPVAGKILRAHFAGRL